MKVIVCGAGQVGFDIARQLSAEDNDVTVVDHDYERLRKVNDALDVLTLQGFASYPDILQLAGAETTDMLIAVTQVDEINMVSCQVAHTLFNIPIKIARIRHHAYLEPNWQHLFSRDQMPIDVIISPENEVVESIGRLLEAPGATDLIGFSKGKIKLVGMRLNEDCPVINTPLRQLTELFPDLNITVVYIIREEEHIYPKEMEQLLPKDEIYFVADSTHVGRAMQIFGHEEVPAQSIQIQIGGRRRYRSNLGGALSVPLIQQRLNLCMNPLGGLPVEPGDLGRSQGDLARSREVSARPCEVLPGLARSLRDCVGSGGPSCAESCVLLLVSFYGTLYQYVSSCTL